MAGTETKARDCAAWRPREPERGALKSPKSHGLCLACMAAAAGDPIEDLEGRAAIARCASVGMMDFSGDGIVTAYSRRESCSVWTFAETVIGKNFFHRSRPVLRLRKFQGRSSVAGQRPMATPNCVWFSNMRAARRTSKLRWCITPRQTHRLCSSSRAPSSHTYRSRSSRRMLKKALPGGASARLQQAGDKGLQARRRHFAHARKFESHSFSGFHVAHHGVAANFLLRVRKAGRRRQILPARYSRRRKQAAHIEVPDAGHALPRAGLPGHPNAGGRLDARIAALGFRVFSGH